MSFNKSFIKIFEDKNFLKDTLYNKFFRVYLRDLEKLPDIYESYVKTHKRMLITYILKLGKFDTVELRFHNTPYNHKTILWDEKTDPFKLENSKDFCDFYKLITGELKTFLIKKFIERNFRNYFLFNEKYSNEKVLFIRYESYMFKEKELFLEYLKEKLVENYPNCDLLVMTENISYNCKSDKFYYIDNIKIPK